VEGYGAGNVPEAVSRKLREAADKGIPTVLITQCSGGRVNLDIYRVGRNSLYKGIVSCDYCTEAALALLSELAAEG